MTVMVDIMLVMAVTSAAGACVAEEVSTGVSGEDWLPSKVDGGRFT